MDFTLAKYNALLSASSVDLDNLLEEVEVIEQHLHGDERWYGKAVTPAGETHIADLITAYTNTHIVAPFQLDAGNENWGAWVQLLGSSDTPMEAGKTMFDFHKILITAAEQTLAPTFIQMAVGTSGAAGLTAKTYTTIGYHTAVNHGSQGAVSFMLKRHTVGTKCWGRTLSIGKNTGTIDFYIGLHEY
jgi:hypothetical protein